MADVPLALFDTTDYRTDPEPQTPELSPDRARTLRQARALAAGRHPLQPIAGHTLRLHPEAAPPDDRTAPGRRCGNCWYRRLAGGGNRAWPKCTFGGTNPTDTDPAGPPPRATMSAASDCRAWWPACTDHSYGDPRVSDDAARWVPEEVAGA